MLRHKRELGSFCFQPSWRLKKVQQACDKNGISLFTALSLRRHVMKHWNKFLGEDKLNLGNSKEKLAAATAFENSIAKYLDEHNISYKREEEQREEWKAEMVSTGRGGGNPQYGYNVVKGGTPDFLLSPPLNVLDPSTGDTKIINWIEAKHFYGCGTIPTDGKSACGKIPKTSEKYRRNFGPGAFVFCYGICEELRAKLGEDVCVLDESILDLTETEALMALYCTRSWDGMLLP